MLGFGFNKTKILASAERYVQQGKLHNAITEYQKILKQDSKDLTVLNTVGDLYARASQAEQATTCFKQVADAYAANGFMVKAIAVYKKLAKLNPGALDYILKLGELYRLQGLHSDARAQYLQATEALLRTGNLQESAQLLEKILELDPENISVQAKLADLYLRLSEKDRALELLVRQGEIALRRGALDAAQRAVDRLVELRPDAPTVMELRGRLALEQGNHAQAATYFEGVPSFQSTEAGLQTLTKVYLQSDQIEKALPAAEKLLTEFGNQEFLIACCNQFISNQQVADAIRIFSKFGDQLVGGPGFVEKLQSCIGRVREDIQSLEMIKRLLEKAGDTTQSLDILELIAHACVQKGELARARDLYQQLASLEPQNKGHLQNYKQVLAKLQNQSDPEIEEEQPARAETSPPVVTPGEDYPSELQEEIRTSLANAELFENFNSPLKAIAALEPLLARAPFDVQINEYLGSVYPRVGRFADAAHCFEKLHQVFSVAGQRQKASEYADLATTYRQRADSIELTRSAAPSDGSEATPQAISSENASGASETAQYVAELFGSSLQSSPEEEIDLSDEWAQVSSEIDSAATSSSTAGETPEEMVEEIRFYLAQALTREAEFAILKLSEIAPDNEHLPDLCEQLANIENRGLPADAADVGTKAGAPPQAVSAPSAGVRMAPDTAPHATPNPDANSAVVKPLEEIEIDPPPHLASPRPSSPPSTLEDFVHDLDQALGDDFVLGPPPSPKPAKVSPAPVATASLTSEPQPIPPPVPAIKPSDPAEETPAAHDESNMLSDLFQEFKEEVEENAPKEDIETHYNLGLAFKEMELFDEAIGEFQKVCQAIEQGQSFGQVIQAYTWLADCLVAKGVPEASFKWYQRALQTAPAEETRTAIHYELAQAYEQAGLRSEALAHYMEVYGSNIDYRDVAERIKALRS